MSTTPLVSDEQIYKRVDGYTLPYRIEITRVAKEFRDIYEAELQAIDAVIHFTAHKLKPSEAVKWLHELYTEQCVTLQECAQKHKIGHGGEKLAKVAAEAIDQREAELQSMRERLSRMESRDVELIGHLRTMKADADNKRLKCLTSGHKRDAESLAALSEMFTKLIEWLKPLQQVAP